MVEVVRKKILYGIQVAIFILLIFGPLYGSTPEIWPDSDAIRPPVYPVFLWLFDNVDKSLEIN